MTYTKYRLAKAELEIYKEIELCLRSNDWDSGEVEKLLAQLDKLRKQAKKDLAHL